MSESGGYVMADTNYIVPGSGIIQDQELGFEPIIPGAGIYNEQPEPAPAGDIVILRRRREEA